MDALVKKEILAMSRTAHGLTESAYQADATKQGDPGWAEKQRLLLADMALHLLQTSLRDGVLSEDDLKRNLYSILTISEQFIPGHGLKAVADGFYSNKAD